MNTKNGLSMVEIMVAVVIIALSVGPLIGLLSSSNRMSNASIYEEMAVHYAREISDQLLSLSPKFSDIVNDARVMTGDSTLTLAAILNDATFKSKLEEHTDESAALSLYASGNQLPVRLIVSPLDKAFSRRRITVSELNTSSNSVLKTDRYWKVKIELAWKDPNSGRDTPREVVMAIFLKEG